ncbi:DUF1283 family protein [Winslowiella iniecta]|uniref:UPF0482 protein NG42_07115 n=1 Tax=Winslowiella iniecta TaxID=1560201 RepID=A0A0L7T604_9GAMM|nr:DUF1283 family protein [Winslowiella iniecta]KOC90829.1 hypothetical protein NG42_07115 [Winslowiella iniecta]KOC94255.1 hypothetical protein NG43_06190 [Winslowiella iniecta]
MKILRKRLITALLPVTLLGGMLAFQPAAMAKTDRVIIESGNTALSSEQARQDKEQWDDTRMLRKKVNSRVEKEFDKTDRAFDTRDACDKSYNVNAYWEPNTLRCLDRRTGRPVTP